MPHSPVSCERNRYRLIRENTLVLAAPEHRLFLLSPASANGERARMVLNDRAKFELAGKVRTGMATLGEVFTFVSGLYFRGKMAYSAAFMNPTIIR